MQRRLQYCTLNPAAAVGGVSPLLEQILRHLYLVRRTCDGYDAIVGPWERFVDCDAGAGVLADLPDPAAALADDGPGQLQ